MPNKLRTKKLVPLLVLMLILNSACGTINVKRPIPIQVTHDTPVGFVAETAPTCDDLLNECAIVVSKQKDAITAQQDVIKKQDDLIVAQDAQVQSEKNQKQIWTVLSVVEGIVLFLLLK